TIPHNMSNFFGRAYSRNDEDGAPYTLKDWERRDRYEPLAEIFQCKRTSECAFGVGTTDEECSFELFWPICKDDNLVGCASKGSYAREGLKLGIELEKEIGFNPLQFGFIGSTDAHNSNPGDTEEWDYRGKAAIKDSPAQKRLAERKFRPGTPITHNPGGLAAIWAEENTRDALFDSMKRKETYATSGTRIRLRFFAGWNFDQDIINRPDMVFAAYEAGVPMGSILEENEKTKKPKFLVWAAKDPIDANLERIQIIKGWIEDGDRKEEVFDIACSDGMAPDSVTGKCPDNGARVNLNTCEITEGSGDEELKVLWTDDTFNPDFASFYYVRVLQNPTCRWSTYDAIRLGIEPIKEVPAFIKERAWSSPIWYSPK
ncbi:MAG: DUF3604 domain-containing protein, partial [Desulfobacula sp.]|uniref:DUF3604 domain-containing protein n=1 Tax=Desulfobacula sp. TaxID=2593537 RepID=UPI0025C693E9